MADNKTEETKVKKKKSSSKKSAHPKPEPEPEIETINEEEPTPKSPSPPPQTAESESATKADDHSDTQALRDMIKEFNNPTPKIPHFNEPYQLPAEVQPNDINALKDIDERKLVELKECFKIFDFNADGFIDHSDLSAMFKSLGEEVPSSQVDSMLGEALDPLDFDAFVVLLGYRTIDMDPEDVLLEALSKWDKDGNGLINEELLRHDLMSFGDKFSPSEVNIALEEAPIAKGTGEGFACSGPCMIEYPAFCKSLCGLRKRVKNPE